MDAITDDNNFWLNAVRCEESGDYTRATLLYLQDGSQCLRSGSLARAAMSCSCAANCLLRMGETADAVSLFSESAALYEENANLMIGRSVREAFWSLLRAYECFFLISNEQSAQRIWHQYVQLASRMDQFNGKINALNTLRNRSQLVQETKANFETSESVPAGSLVHHQAMIVKIRGAITELINLSRSRKSDTSSQISKRDLAISNESVSEEGFRYEGRIVS